MQKYYPATPDRALVWTTRAVWAVLLLPFCLIGLQVFRQGAPTGRDTWLFAGVTLLIGSVGYFTRALAPRGFALDDLELKVDRAMQPVVIPLREITLARPAEPDETKGMLRLFGASGFYGHYGWFWTRKLGRFRLYSCRFGDLVLVRAAGGLFVLGPDEPEAFLADLRLLTRR